MTAYPITPSQAAFLTKLSATQADYQRSLDELEENIKRENESILKGHHTRGMNHQTMQEIVANHAAYTTLIEIAHEALNFPTRAEFDTYFTLAITPDPTAFLGRRYFRSSIED